jgi:hypothetical protein
MKAQLSHKMHDFVTKKRKKIEKGVFLGIKGKTKHFRKISEDLNDENEFTFSPRIVKIDNVHSFLNTTLIYKCKGDFYNTVPIIRFEDNNIKLLWFTMVILIIGLIMLFKSYIITTELILRL